MSESATLSRRERRKQETASSLTAVTRRFTAQRGLSGFTVEDVCDEVDVSRRTFFNYFASKEDAVIGIAPADESQRFADEFLARGAGDWTRVVDDLVELVILHFETCEIDTVGHNEFKQALEREPRLLARFIGISRERDRQAMALIAKREGVPLDDARVEAAVNILSTLLRSAIDHLLDPANTRDFATILTESLALFRALLATPAPRLP